MPSNRLRDRSHLRSARDLGPGGPQSHGPMQGVHLLHNVQSMHSTTGPAQTLLTARQVQDILRIDRSTVYRMAETGRLPAIRVGKQWRFPADKIAEIVAAIPPQAGAPQVSGGLDRARAEAVIGIAADLLGVMMVVTDMDGQPITSIANPCDWFIQHGQDPEVMAACTAEWRLLAENHRFEPQFSQGPNGFECARVFIRSDRELIGMVLAGGVRPRAGAEDRNDLFDLTDDQRQRVLAALPDIALAISRPATVADGVPTKRPAPVEDGAQMKEKP